MRNYAYSSRIHSLHCRHLHITTSKSYVAFFVARLCCSSALIRQHQRHCNPKRFLLLKRGLMRCMYGADRGCLLQHQCWSILRLCPCMMMTKLPHQQWEPWYALRIRRRLIISLKDRLCLKRYVEPASKFELQLKFFFTHTLFSNMLLHFVTEKTSEILLILWCYS